MFFLMKREVGIIGNLPYVPPYNIIAVSRDKELLVRRLTTELQQLKTTDKGFTYKPLKVLENRKSIELIATNYNTEYFVAELQPVSLKEYL